MGYEKENKTEQQNWSKTVIFNPFSNHELSKSNPTLTSCH